MTRWLMLFTTTAHGNKVRTDVTNTFTMISNIKSAGMVTIAGHMCSKLKLSVQVYFINTIHKSPLVVLHRDLIPIQFQQSYNYSSNKYCSVAMSVIGQFVKHRPFY